MASRNVNALNYSKDDNVFTQHSAPDGSFKWDEWLYKISLELRKVVALESISGSLGTICRTADRLYNIASKLDGIETVLNRIEDLMNPATAAAEAKGRAVRAKANRQAESRRRCELLYLLGTVSDASPLDAIGLDPRTLYLLNRGGWKTVGELCRSTYQSVSYTRGIGPEKMKRIRAALKAIGRGLADDQGAEGDPDE